MSKELETVKDFPIATHDELSKVLRSAAERNAAIVPGIRRKLPKDVQAKHGNREFAFLDLSKMDKVLEHCLEDQVIKVETGISVNKLNEYLMKSRQWWPVSAVDDNVTVFDVINTGFGGPLDHRFGGPRQLVLGLDVALASGDITKCGGRVVKNVTGYDVTKLFVGSHATLGIPYAAYLRLYALPEIEKTLCWISNDAKVLVDLARNLTGSGLPLSCLELIDSHLLYDLASEDTKAVESMGVVLHQRQAMLMARLHGHATEVAELSQEALTIGNQLKISGQEVADALAITTWVKLSSPGSVLGAEELTISATWTQISKIVEKWRTEHKFVLWQARPNMSLIKIFAQDKLTMLELKESLKSFFKPHDEELIIAFSDDEFETTTEYLGQDTSSVDELKKTLKTKFDPSGFLNPLAAL